MSTTELRTYRSPIIVLRSGPENKPQISGIAAAYNTRSQDLGGFLETIFPGAFDRAIREKQDVRSLFNHDASQILGRTKAGTLRLTSDSVGLRFVVDLPDTQLGRDLATSIDRGDIDGCSFSFTVRSVDWGECEDPSDKSQRIPLRTLKDVDLFDVSPVTYPAYPVGTSVSTYMPNVSAIDPAAKAVEAGFNSIPPQVLAEARARCERLGRPLVIPTTRKATEQVVPDRYELHKRAVALGERIAQSERQIEADGLD